MRKPIIRHTKSRGQALTELAFVAPLLIVMIAGIVQVGMLFYAQMTLENVARDAVRQASLDPYTTGVYDGYGNPKSITCPNASSACTAAYSSAGLLPPSQLTITIEGYPTSTTQSTCTTSNPSEPAAGEIRATVTYSAPIFIPLIGPLFATGASSTRTLTTQTYSAVGPCAYTEAQLNG
ncbi:MAG: TadE family protein [Candidatus Dormibacteria bacterium]